MVNLVEEDAINNQLGYRGWDANWRTVLHTALSASIEGWAAVRGASEGAILAGRFTKNPYGVLGGTIVGGVIGSAVGHELAQTTIEELRKVGL